MSALEADNPAGIVEIAVEMGIAAGIYQNLTEREFPFVPTGDRVVAFQR